MSKSYDELELPIDPGYRNFVAALDKILKLFENTSEWQDLIASLGRLNRVLQTHGTKYHVVPRRVLVGKRLAQCMHPNLPSGVHLKAIETYDTIFKMIGSSRLSQQLFIYSSGIFPLLALAATSVKPALLQLYEVHFVPLGNALKPGLPGLLAGTLPALEEGSENFDRVESLLEKICDAVGPSFFYLSVWEGIFTNPTVRRPALEYILRHFEKQKTLEEQPYLFGNSLKIMVQALCACLEDSSILVERAALEFIVVALPLGNCPIPPDDRILLASLAVSTILKRDMSLNRRLYAWLLGQDATQAVVLDVSQNDASHFFDKHSKDILVKAIKHNMKQSPTDVKQYRILISLLEKPEIGPEIIDSILVDIFRSIDYAAGEYDHSDNKLQDFLRIVSLLFTSLEPHYVWSFVAEKFQEICDSKSRNPVETQKETSVRPIGDEEFCIPEMCILSDTLLNRIPLEKETLESHLPRCCAEILKITTEYCSVLTFKEIAESLVLCDKIFQKIESFWEKTVPVELDEETGSGFVSACQSPTEVSRFDEKIPKLGEFRKLIVKCYTAFVETKVLLEKFSLDFIEVKDKDSEKISSLLQNVVHKNGLALDSVIGEETDGCRTVGVAVCEQKCVQVGEACAQSYKTLCDLLLKLATYPQLSKTFEGERAWKRRDSAVSHTSNLPVWLDDLICLSLSPSQVQLTSIELLLELIYLTQSSQETMQVRKKDNFVSVILLPLLRVEEFDFLVNKTRMYEILARILWKSMKTNQAKELVADLVYKLHGLIPPTSEQYMEEEILGDFQLCSVEGRDSIFSNFTPLWKRGRTEPGSKPVRSFDKSLFRIFDFLSHPSCQLQASARRWLRENLQRGDSPRIFDPLLQVLLGKSVIRRDPRSVRPPPVKKVSKDHQLEPKIRAISSVNGDVIYYVAGSDDVSQPKGNRILTVTSIDSDSYVTKESDVKNINFPWLHRQIVNGKLLKPVSMFVNPMEGVEGVELGQEAHARSSSMPHMTDESESKSPRRHSLSDISSPAVRLALEREAHEIAEEIVDDIIEKAIRKAVLKPIIKPSDSVMKVDIQIEKVESPSPKKFPDIRKSFGFLYTEPPDFERIRHILEIIQQVVEIEPKLVLWSLATNSINKQESKFILHLLAQHRMNLLGKNFDITAETESTSLFRSFMYLDAVLYSMLGFTRSFLPESEPSASQLMNLNLQLESLKVLTTLTKYLIELVLNSGASFAAYVRDLYKRCKVHKIVVLTLLHQYEKADTKASAVISSGLEMLLQLVILDSTLEGVVPKKGEIRTAKDHQYQPDLPVYLQPIFITFFEQALDDSSFHELYEIFTSFFIKSLPYLGPALPAISMFVFRQFTQFLDETMELRGSGSDFEVSLFEGLTVIVHYSVIGGVSSIPPSYGGVGSYRRITESTEVSNTQILSNLLHAFSPGLSKEEGVEQPDPLIISKRLLLSNLSRLIQCGLIGWQVAKEREASLAGVLRTRILEMLGPISCNCLFNFLSAVALVWHDQKTKGVPKKVTSCEVSQGQEDLVDLVSNLKVLPPDTLISNIRNVFKNPPQVQGISSKFSLEVSLLQFLMAYLPKLSAVQLMESRESLFALLNDGAMLSPNALILCLSILELWIVNTPVYDKKSPKEVQDIFSKLVDSCLNVAGSCLEQTTWLRRNLAVKRDAQLPTVVQGEVLTSSGEVTINDENADSRGIDIQTQQDSGAGPASNSPSNTTLSNSGSQVNGHSNVVSTSADGTSALLALQALSEVFPSLLDTIFTGEDRDKATPLLASVMTVVVPYLRGHSSSTMGGYRCGAELLAGISSYQFTRRAWRREAFELVFEANFFQMDYEAIIAWKKIVENLLVYEKSAFKDLLARVPVGQASLNLFTSREADAENRAMLLKRLSFAIFCGDKDEFQHHMPEIQERLADCLRLGQMLPSIQAVVFLCFRVLLVRISDACLTSLWPTIITELVQSLSLLEHELNRDTPEFRDDDSAYLAKLAALESTWVVGNSSLQTRNHPGWLQVYLQASKLLDLALTLPPDELPQFQLYRWAFVGLASESHQNGPEDIEYVPHSAKIARAMRHKVKEAEVFDMQGYEPGTPVITSRSIKSLIELYPFYNLISQPEFTKVERLGSSSEQSAVEKSLLCDFLEPFE